MEKAEQLAKGFEEGLAEGDSISLPQVVSAFTRGSARPSGEKRSPLKVYLKQGSKTLVQASRKPGEVKITLRHGAESSEDIERVLQQVLRDCRDGNL